MPEQFFTLMTKKENKSQTSHYWCRVNNWWIDWVLATNTAIENLKQHEVFVTIFIRQ